MRLWQLYREAARDMRQSGMARYSSRGWMGLVFVFPLGMACMAYLLVSYIVSDPTRITTLDGLRDVGGIFLIAAMLVGFAVVQIRTFRSEERDLREHQRVDREH